MLTADIQVPVLRHFGLSVGGAIGRPHKLNCVQGADCQSRTTLTMIKANAMLLARFKPGVPVYFGLGAGATRLHPGAVDVLQDSLTLTETGFVGLIGFDVSLASRVGARIVWWHYFSTPKADGLSTDYTTSRTHDSVISVSARIKLVP